MRGFVGNTHQGGESGGPVSLKIKFKSASLQQFIDHYSDDINQGGIFIRTREPLPVGTALRFEFQLKDASPLLSGEGTVIWAREPATNPGLAPGMGVRFDKLPADSQHQLKSILTSKAHALQQDQFKDEETRIAPDGLFDDPEGSFNDDHQEVAT